MKQAARGDDFAVTHEYCDGPFARCGRNLAVEFLPCIAEKSNVAAA